MFAKLEVCIQGHSSAECERECDSALQLQIPSLQQLISILAECASPAGSFCVCTQCTRIPLLQAGRRTSEHQCNEAGLVLENPTAVIFLKAFHTQGINSLCRGSWILAAGQPSTKPFCCCCCSLTQVQLLHLNAAFPSLWHPKRGNLGKLRVLGMWIGIGVMQRLKNLPAVQAFGSEERKEQINKHPQENCSWGSEGTDLSRLFRNAFSAQLKVCNEPSRTHFLLH